MLLHNDLETINRKCKKNLLDVARTADTNDSVCLLVIPLHLYNHSIFTNKCYTRTLPRAKPPKPMQARANTWCVNPRGTLIVIRSMLILPRRYFTLDTYFHLEHDRLYFFGFTVQPITSSWFRTRILRMIRIFPTNLRLKSRNSLTSFFAADARGHSHVHVQGITGDGKISEIYNPSQNLFFFDIFIDESPDIRRSDRLATKYNNMNFKIPIFSTNSFEHSFTVTAIRLWRNLPIDVINALSLETFKIKAFEFF
ncbi:Protein of unknown function [Cotesia congregata]|uniref:Uncharacterized protein n=1 Tax=Cotesia congregata TaxID=51543 RepID=A0A8J2MMZ2_COTCN|nr:Protein of unknown function [Cotesia congregata]